MSCAVRHLHAGTGQPARDLLGTFLQYDHEEKVLEGPVHRAVFCDDFGSCESQQIPGSKWPETIILLFLFLFFSGHLCPSSIPEAPPSHVWS